jgi:hypothetical protein
MKNLKNTIKNVAIALAIAGPLVFTSGCSKKTQHNEMIYKSCSVNEENLHLTFSKDTSSTLKLYDPTRIVGVGDTTGLVIGEKYNIDYYDNALTPDEIKVREK